MNQLTGPVTAGPGSGSQVATITPTGVTPGSYTSANITVNAAGQVTAAASGSGGSGITELTGDILAGPGSGSQVSAIAPQAIVNADVNNAAQINWPKLKDIGLANGGILGAPGAFPVSEMPYGPVSLTLGGILTTANARAYVGIQNLSSTVHNALARAQEVCGFPLTPLVYVVNCLDLPGSANSKLNTILSTGGSAEFVRDPAWPRGRRIVAPNAGYYQAFSQEGGIYTAPLIPAVTTSKWLISCNMLIPSGIALSANGEVAVGLYGNALEGGPCVGYRRSESGTTWRAFIGQSATGVNGPAYSLDTWTNLKAWSNGDGNVYFSVNNGTAVSFAWPAPASASMGPWLAAMGGAGEGEYATALIDQCVYVVNGGVDV